MLKRITAQTQAGTSAQWSDLGWDALLQVYPSVLAPRMQRYIKSPFKGKAYMPNQIESQCMFKAPVRLIDIFHMPLAVPQHA